MPRFLLLFDIDGTLIRTGRVVKKAYCRAMMDTFGSVGRVNDLSFAGMTDPMILREALLPAGVDAEELRQRSAECLELYVHHLQRAAPNEPPGIVLPGVVELLETLRRDARFVLGLLTGNCRAGADVKLRTLGLDRYFAFGAFGEEGEQRVELAPIAYRRGQETANEEIPPERVAVIGDTVHDVRCARAIGAHAVIVLTGWQTREELATARPDLLLDDLRGAAAEFRALLL